tara:strand:+ start:20529 stop:20753 length:225 start_codon:yes stop_codon:yes gene_type:complete
MTSTVTVNGDLYQALKDHAHNEGKTIKEVVAIFLKEKLNFEDIEDKEDKELSRIADRRDDEPTITHHDFWDSVH